MAAAAVLASIAAAFAAPTATPERTPVKRCGTFVFMAVPSTGRTPTRSPPTDAVLQEEEPACLDHFV